ncbi:MAG TPA: DUF4062 domain-containing protein [Thermoanaerobaculia bacterium]|nr:DUF4062 domain-containing protein [Thermoanaerobaculia bacterium]
MPVQSPRNAFVSSTFTDLQPVRNEVRATLRRVGYLDGAMEYLSAADERPLDASLQLVREADLYIGLFAWRYGFVPPGQRLSITELEYRAAREAGKPCIILLLSDRAPWPVRLVDNDRRLIERLRKELSAEHTVAFFDGPADVAGRLYEALHRYERSRGIHGVLEEAEKRHRRAVEEVARRQAEHHHSIRLFDFQKDIRIEDVYVQEILQAKRDKSPFDELELSGHQKGKPVPEQELLEKVVTDRDTSVFVVEGRAGAGKSTMLKMWMLNLLAAREAPKLFPLLVSLRHLHGEPGAPAGLVEAICRTTSGLTPDLVQPLLESDAPRPTDRDPALLLLFDGLDETPADARRGFLEGLGALHQRRKAVVSTRPGVIAETGMTPLRSRAYELCDFDEKQVVHFISQWFAKRPEPGRELLAKIEANARLGELAAIPVLLTCLAMHAELYDGFRLPDGVAEGKLLEDSVEILVERWDAARDGRSPDSEYIALCFDVFTRLAAWPRHEDVPWNDFLAAVRAAGGGPPVARRIVQNGRVLAGEAGGSVHFAHAIFYDFFYAERFARNLAGNA